MRASYIITRDTENLRTKEKMRQCWTGQIWSADINEVRIFTHESAALMEQMDLSFHKSPARDIAPPGFVLHPADVREITQEDVENIAPEAIKSATAPHKQKSTKKANQAFRAAVSKLSSLTDSTPYRSIKHILRAYEETGKFYKRENYYNRLHLVGSAIWYVTEGHRWMDIDEIHPYCEAGLQMQNVLLGGMAIHRMRKE